MLQVFRSESVGVAVFKCDFCNFEESQQSLDIVRYKYPVNEWCYTWDDSPQHELKKTLFFCFVAVFILAGQHYQYKDVRKV